MVKIMQSRNSRGQFINKSKDNRQVRSIRVTNEVWVKLGNMATQRSITRADLLEEIVKNDLQVFNVSQVVINSP